MKYIITVEIVSVERGSLYKDEIEELKDEIRDTFVLGFEYPEEDVFPIKIDYEEV